MFSVASVFAFEPTAGQNKYPQGVFKKKRNGDLVQYNSDGKRIHTYKMKNGKILKIK